jgi:hypothetical protein
MLLNFGTMHFSNVSSEPEAVGIGHKLNCFYVPSKLVTRAIQILLKLTLWPVATASGSDEASLTRSFQIAM